MLLLLSALQKEPLNNCILIENFLFHDSHGTIAMLLLGFLHFNIEQGILRHLINLEMLQMDIVLFVHFSIFIILNSSHTYITNCRASLNKNV